MPPHDFAPHQNILLKIANFYIQLHPEDSYPLSLEEGYLPFLTDEEVEPDFTIKVSTTDLSQHLPTGKLLFESRNETTRFFAIHQHNGAQQSTIYDQFTQVVQQVVDWDKDLKIWHVMVHPTSNGRSLPLRYPLGPLMLYHLTTLYPAVMVHASAVNDMGKGRLFSGFSGVGKSTISGIWAKSGALLVNDDRIIIRRSATGFEAHNTPMFYVDEPKVTPLHAVYLISHSPENRMKPLKKAAAVSRVMAHCIQHGHNAQNIEAHLNFFSEMCAQIPVFDLGFVPNASVIDFVHNAD